MKFLTYDEQGKISGFYSEDTHGARLLDGEPNPDCKIPPGAIEITEEEWLDCLQNPGKWLVDIATGSLVLAPPPPPPTEDEMLAAIRARRDALLRECDWTQLPDVPMDAQYLADWRTYRQALRDFPATCDPVGPVWPTPPG